MLKEIYDEVSYVTLGDEESKYVKFLDEIFLSFIKEKNNVKEYRIPAMIKKAILRKCGYFETFPQHLTVAATIKQESYEDAKNLNDDEEYTISENYFTPAACLHIYPTLEGKKIDGNYIYTTMARVYRNEANKFEYLVRLWDFTVREIVFIGSPEFVEKELTEIEEKAIKFAMALGFNPVVKKANDHFYPSKKNEIKEKIQLANSLKDELVVRIGDKDVALCSFNTHNYHFSKTFKFDNDGKVVSGCVGFGIERWIAAIKYYNVSIEKILKLKEERGER